MATAILTRTQATAGRSPVALWHLLSLDAPCVAGVWTAFLAHQFRIAESVMVPAALGVAAWLLYAADRISDAARGEISEERHRFHLLHRRSFLIAGAVATVLLAILVAHLPRALRHGWLLLVSPLCIYLVAVHVLQLHRLSKEPLVAVIFSAAVVMPVAVHRPLAGDSLLPVLVAFGSLCWLNCIAIARWEQSLTKADACTAWLGRHFALAVALTVCVALPLLAARPTFGVGIAAACAALCLLLLDTARGNLARTTVRALADAALLTPIIVWPLLSLLKWR